MLELRGLPGAANASTVSKRTRQARARAYIEWLGTRGRAHVRCRARELSAGGWLDRDSHGIAPVYGRAASHRRSSELAHIAGVSQRIASWLWPHRKTVRFFAHLDLRDLAARGIERIYHVVVATR